ncbi:MAG TPA: hypothetical protein VNA15_12210 [Candidatus Angelobacter sp.]|nr:hypothetical protein [Candidatus Angelobacter sp.]
MGIEGSLLCGLWPALQDLGVINLLYPSGKYRYTPILSDATRFYGDKFGATVVAKAYGAMFHIPCRIHLSTCLTHQAKCPNIGASLT